jgi:hypothetical protein
VRTIFFPLFRAQGLIVEELLQRENINVSTTFSNPPPPHHILQWWNILFKEYTTNIVDKVDLCVVRKAAC